MGNTTAFVDSVEQGISACQRTMRIATAVILCAFVLIILLTTVSTGTFVQTAAKVLYFAILAAALVSAGCWYRRSRLERSRSAAAAGGA